MLKFLIDESSGRNLFLYLLERGFDVKFVTNIMPRADDTEILEFCEREGRILITNDKDFGELIFRFGKHSFGVILLRLKKDFPVMRCERILYVIKNFKDDLKDHFIVVNEKFVRIRKL